MPEQIQGTVENTTFHNEENGYSVLNLRVSRKEVTVVGTLPPLSPGENVVLTGDWTEHPKYGKQFKCTACEIQKPSTLAGIEKFLSSGIIKGIGPATARLLVQEFGKNTLEALDGDPEKLAVIKGISVKRAEQICKSYAEQYAVREGMIYLQSYGVSASLAVKISRLYQKEVRNVIQTNPYRLADDIEGIGFQTADRIALMVGIARDSSFRLESGIKYTLSEAAISEGHTYLPSELLLTRAAAILKMDRELLENSLRALLLNKELISVTIDGVDSVFLKSYFYAEAEVAKRLLDLRGTAQTTLHAVNDRRITQFEKQHGITLSLNQRKAVHAALENGLIVITGGPGTGKTTIINCILSLLDTDALLAAPTGRAAKRMCEATSRTAKTLHRLLEYAGEEGKFTKNEDDPLDGECVIVDEMSMVDIFLMRSLLRALRPGTRLILVGDADQLPSVGAGNVLGDILGSNVIPCARLTDIFRQANESMIVVNAHRINHGEMPILNQKGSDFFFERMLHVPSAADSILSLCAARLPRFLKTDNGVRDIQVLAPTKKGTCGVYQLNKLLQDALNPRAAGKRELIYNDITFRKGDKVMHIKNDYEIEWITTSGEEGKGVFNGDIGYILEVDNENHSLTVLYDDERRVEYEYAALEELDLAYCLSIHKSQGSEFPCVVIPVVGGPKMLLTRNLFYTALTRAKQLVVLVGNEAAIAEMVNNDHIILRYTALRLRLEDFDQMG